MKIEWERLEITLRKLQIPREHLSKVRHNKGQKKNKNLTETGGIKIKWQEYTEELDIKALNDLDIYDGAVTQLEPDILECEVKWGLGSITTSKASGNDGIPAELFQILKDDSVKVIHSILQQIWKTQQLPQEWKRFIFFFNP